MCIQTDRSIKCYIRFIFFFVLILFLGASKTILATPAKIEIDITTHMGNSTEFLDGDEITFLLSLNQDCHILVIYQNARNEIYQLLPNRNHSTSFFRKGSFRPLPAPDAPFVFKAEPPFGKETIWVFAADVPLPKLDGENLKSGLRKLKQGIVLLRNKIHLHPKQAYGETSLILRTQPRN